MKKVAYILMIIGIALIVSGFACICKNAADNERRMKINWIVQDALYGEEHLSYSALLAGEFKWVRAGKLHAERISEGHFKVYIPKAMYKVKERLAKLES